MPVKPANQVVSQPVSWLRPERIPLGKLLMLDGDPDLGKSLIALDLCARLSTGRPFPDGRSSPGPANSLVLSAEDNAADTIVPRLERLGADVQRVFVWQREGEGEDEDWPWRFPAHVDRLALARAMYYPHSLVLLLSRSQRQSAELFRIVRHYYTFLVPEQYRKQLTAHELEMTHGSRIVSLPCSPDTIRGYANVQLLVIDEAARVPDHLYRTVRPMLAVARGRMVLLSTPCGKRGFFFDTWTDGGPTWHRIQVPAAEVPRIAPEFLDEERRALGESWFRQEYCCSFEALEGLVYPGFARCVVPGPAPDGRKVGGIDFGFHNPFAAVWGVVDRDGILWLTGEHYQRQRPLPYHAEHLPRGVRWYADPSGASDIEELVCAGFAVSPGENDIRPGIAAVTARLESDRLRVVAGACPNLLREASLYRYSEDRADRRSETPVDEHNHALAALRYLVSMIDARQMARMKGKGGAGETTADGGATAEKPKRKWLSVWNEFLWRRID